MCRACYRCAHVRDNPGTHHKRCVALDLLGVPKNPMAELLGILHRGHHFDHRAIQVSDSLRPKAAEHGIRMGWWNWPYNFDPVWLEECKLFSENPQDEGEGKESNGD